MTSSVTQQNFSLARGLGLFALALLVLTNFGCATFFGPDPAPIDVAMRRPVFPQAQRTIQSGDTLKVQFLYHKELNVNEMVGADGNVFFPLIGERRVFGKTVQQLHEELKTAYSKDLVDPDIAVSLDRSQSSMVYVAGEVRNGGAKALLANTTVAQMIAACNPDLVKGDVSSVLLVRKNKEEEGSKAYEINADYRSGQGRDVYLMPGDIVVVPRKGIVLVGDVIQQYVRDLLPPQLGLNMGFFYEINRDGYPE